MVSCPICDRLVKEADINRHLDSGCKAYLEQEGAGAPPATRATGTQSAGSRVASFFTPSAKKSVSFGEQDATPSIASVERPPFSSTQPAPFSNGIKRPAAEEVHVWADSNNVDLSGEALREEQEQLRTSPPTKKRKSNAHAPLAERMRPQSLDEVAGQELVGAHGVLRNLITRDHVPSMILWGGPGTGKTTIARLIANTAGTRFVEINSTSSGVAECKKLFDQAKNELNLTGRKTIIFCDEIHRFNKSQQDVFLGPVEAGQVTLIGATTENPSFKVVNALLSRCRTFTLSKLSEQDVFGILKRALVHEIPEALPTPSPSSNSQATEEDITESTKPSQASGHHLLTQDDCALLRYLSAFADGDARTALNLLELALDLCQRADTTADDIKRSLTQTLVYDRAGDQHYDTISAFHKSVRGSNPDAALYYLARMLQSGEDPLYVARRMVVIASEDVGLADNTLLSLATATYTAAEKIGMPECRINLAHCAVALCEAPKSTRSYRGLNAAYKVLNEPGVAGLPIPIHLRNAPTRLMKEMGYGKEYKYNPDYVDGHVVQDYLPEKLEGRRFLSRAHLGDKVDLEIEEQDEMIRVAEQLETEDVAVLLGPDGD